MKDKIIKTTFILSIIVFLSMVFLLFSGNVFYIDKYVFELIRQFDLYSFFMFVTKLGGKKFIIALILLSFLLYKKKREIPISLVSLAAITTLINQYLKYSIQRPRPLFIKLINETGYSFPSGHTMISVSIYGYLIYLISKSKLEKWIKITLITLLSALIILIPMSRVYLGVHFASDIIAGASLSYLILYTFIRNKDYFIKK